MSSKIKILFLCTGNSCRSQMAEGWARHLKRDRLEPQSAGVVAKGLDSRAVEVMREIGIDISHQRSKRLTELAKTDFDYVVTVCDQARETCPVVSGTATQVHMGFEDPPRLAAEANSEEEALAHYRRIRDDIGSFLETLLENLPSRAITAGS